MFHSFGLEVFGLNFGKNLQTFTLLELLHFASSRAVRELSGNRGFPAATIPRRFRELV